MDSIALLIAAAGVISLGLLVAWRKETSKKNQAQSELNAFKTKYSSVIDVDSYVSNRQKEARGIQDDIENIRHLYSEKKGIYDNLLKQIAIYDEKIGLAELGLYEPHFDFSDSEEYKKQIERVREKQKVMIKAETAINAGIDWSVDGSAAKGKTMVNRQRRLTLRAFNNESEAAISNVRWNNITTMEKRIISAASAINRENQSLKLEINPNYVNLKIEELRLSHEYRERQKKEREERSEMARAEREERKIQQEMEAAEREERKYQEMLAKARKEVNANSEEAIARISYLEKALSDAHDAVERAKAMAEITTSGYVYIISNIGSFGEDMFKIGLTRRLDPDDRVRELGDASVPFAFDTHAMIYSESAPALENALHREFADRRINTSNYRKEFFRVSIDEVEQAVSKLAPQAKFFKNREAQEWHETIARRNAKVLEILFAEEVNKFPDSI